MIHFAFLVCAVRWVVACSLIGSGSHVAIVYGLSEILGCALSLRNISLAVAWDNTLVGCLVPVCYCVGLFIKADWNPFAQSAVLVFVLVSLCVVAIYIRWVLGIAYSNHSPTWVHLVEVGPYRYVRHPLVTIAVLTRFVFLLGNWSGWNVFVSLCYLGALLLSVWFEERFLAGVDDWRLYSLRVRSRFWPGLI